MRSKIIQKVGSVSHHAQSLSSGQHLGNGGENSAIGGSISGSLEKEAPDQKGNQSLERANVGDQGSVEGNSHSSCACQRLTIHVLDISKVYSAY